MPHIRNRDNPLVNQELLFQHQVIIMQLCNYKIHLLFPVSHVDGHILYHLNLSHVSSVGSFKIGLLGFNFKFKLLHYFPLTKLWVAPLLPINVTQIPPRYTLENSSWFLSLPFSLNFFFCEDITPNTCNIPIFSSFSCSKETTLFFIRKFLAK